MRTERQKSLKPILTLNQSIYSAYWPPSDPQRLSSPQWYPGTISQIHLSKLPADTKYGYIHYYSIKFDDGDYCKMVEEHLVMDRKEYELSLQLIDEEESESDSDDEEDDRKKKKESNKKGSGWKGVKNVCDRLSADNWAKHVGWYVATLQNENGNTIEHTFSLLSDALRAYDANLVRLKGLVNVTDDELNLPNDWISSRITSDGKGKKGSSASKVSKKLQQQQKETAIQLKMETKRATKLSAELSKLKEEHATLTSQLSTSQQQPTNEEDIKQQIKTAVQKSTKRHKADIDRLKHHLNSKYETSKQLAISDTITNEQRKFREEKLQMKKELTVLHTAQLNSLRNSLDDEKARLQKNMELKEKNIEEIYKKKKLKPLFEVGDEVYAAYFEDVNDIENSKWYPGRVRSYYDIVQGKSNEVEEDGDVKMKGNNVDNMEEEQLTYGPTRVYTVRYDVDGSELAEIPECYVFTKKDYLLSTEKDVMKASSSPSGATISSSSPSAKSLKSSGLRAKPKSNKKGKYPLEGFPNGWTKERIPRKSSGSDSYYYSPIEHYKFDSMVKANRFLECLKKVNGDEVLALEEFRSANKYVKATVDERSSSSPNTALSTQKKKSPATKTWKGVKNVVDESSNDTWAQLVGWYVFDNVDDGKQQTFSHLSDAIRAYDASVVRAKGDKTKRIDLNLPEDWEWLFSEDGVHEPVMMTEDEYNEALAKEVDGFVKEVESMKKKLDQTHKREKTLAVKEAIDAERKKHHALRKRWKIDSDREKAEAVAAANKKSKEVIEAAAKENQKKIGQAMKEAKKAMHDAREREEMAVKEASVMHNLQMDKLRSELHQQYEHDKDKALYWARVELEQKHEDQLKSMQAGKASSLSVNNLPVKSDESPVPNKTSSPARKKQGLHRGSENIEESSPAPPAKRTKLATAVSGEAVGAAAVKENVPLTASSSFSSTETTRKQRQQLTNPKPLPKNDQSAGESSTEEKNLGDHLDPVNALLQYAEKLDSEEEGSIHSAMSVEEEEKNKDEKEYGVEPVKLSIIV